MSVTKISPRVFLAEDDPLIALDLELTLAEHGFAVAGTCGDVESGLRMLDAEEFDVAILNWSLRGATCQPMLPVLLSKRVPVVFFSGWSGDLAKHFPNARVVSKPYLPEELSEALRAVIASSIREEGVENGVSAGVAQLAGPPDVELA